MASEKHILKSILGLTVTILLTHVCEVKTNDFTSKASQMSYIDEPQNHIRQKYEVISMSLRINAKFDIIFINHQYMNYQNTAKNIQSAIDTGYGNLPNYIKGSAKVIGFRPGTVIADYTINATAKYLNFTAANRNVSSILIIQGFSLPPDAFAQTEQKNLSTTEDKIYPYQSMTLNCPQSVKGAITWSVNEKDPDNTTYTISVNGSTLTLNNATERDSGRYSCIIENDSIPYIQWQNIVIEKQPEIHVGNDEYVFPCDERTIQLTCCVNAGYSIEWVLNGTVKTSGSGCITFNHTTLNGSCTEKTFTCRLKDLQQLYEYSYSMTSVKIMTKAEDFDCEDNTLGFGKTNDTTERPCDNGKKGNIIYTCESEKWNTIQNNCVYKLPSRHLNLSMILSAQEIPHFMANLTSIVEQNNASITQSAANVQEIVQLLSAVAVMSENENLTIHKPVAENILTTVDIITSNESTDTWNELNFSNFTDKNISVNLLQALETFGSHLPAENFNITKPSIQLNRIITAADHETFSVKSQLPNSNTEIVIPNVPKSSSITIIIFTYIGNVLPTKHTPNNHRQTSENQVNGDVVVVQVEPAINNISFTFDITDTSLTNPQCVFWNFSLDQWDSTGCKIKLLGYDTVTCECNHTTSFSILMSPVANEDPEKQPALDYITYIGVAISIASLILCLIIEMIVWKSVTGNNTSYMRHVSIVNIAVCLLIADIWFIVGAAIFNPGQETPVNPCTAAVFFVHFFYLALFFWILILALLLLYRTVMILSQMSRTEMMVIAFTVGYCAPLLIAVITVASTAGAGRYIWTRDACWLNWYESKALLAFVIPTLTIVAFNLLVLIVILCKTFRRRDGATTDPDERHVLVVIVRCVSILTPIFGLTWGFGIGTMVSPEFGIHVVFTILNALQGFFVLVFGTLSDRKVQELLPGKLLIKNLFSSHTKSTTARTFTRGLGDFQRGNAYNMSKVSGVSSSSSNSSSASNTLMNA